MPELTRDYNKQTAALLKAYYQKGTRHPNDSKVFVESYQAMQKADVPLSYSGSTTWFDPVYLGKVTLESLTRSRKFYGAIPKTTYAQEGDSYQTIAADVTDNFGPMLENGALYGTTSVPQLTDVDFVYPAIFHIDWSNTEVAAAMSQIQRSRTTPTLQEIRDYMTDLFWDKVDQQLIGTYLDPAGTTTGHGVDTPATVDLGGGVSVATFESIDRWISGAAESGGTNYVSAATDGDIFLNASGTGTAKFDRSANGFDCNLRLPTTESIAAGEVYNICDELDDLMTKCLAYNNDDTPNYVAYMSPKVYNKIKAENDPKALITDYQDAAQTINGITSTPGVIGGKVQLSALRLSDITVPIVTDKYFMGTGASNWVWKTSKHTIGGPGHVFLVNQNAAEFRILIPFSYRAVQAENALETKHTLYMAGQLIFKNAKSHGALKYIAN